MSVVPTLKRPLNTSYRKNCPAMSAPKKMLVRVRVRVRV